VRGGELAPQDWDEMAEAPLQQVERCIGWARLRVRGLPHQPDGAACLLDVACGAQDVQHRARRRSYFGCTASRVDSSPKGMGSRRPSSHNAEKVCWRIS